MLRTPLRWLPRVALAALFVACSSTKDETKPDPTPPDDTPKDPAHCQFETPPVTEAGPASDPAPLRAGVASVVLPMPIGTPQGGYAARVLPLGGKAADDRARRFAKSLAPSVGIHDAPRAEALALEAGNDKVVIVRIDSIFINENNLFELENRAAPDGSLRGRIIVTASHSHAAWAGWQSSLILMPGIDRPRKDLADRMVDAMAEAVKGALAALEPAKIGVGIESNFDPQNTVNRDRRHDNDELLGPDGNTAGKSKDPTLWALRVDRSDGSPIAALVDFPIHGTIGGDKNPLVSGDAPSAVGRALTHELGYPVLHLQGAAGDVSPAGDNGRNACPDSFRCLDMPRIEAVGARAAKLIAPLVKGIQTGDKASFEIVTRTFYIGHDKKVTRPDGTVLEYAPADPDYEPDGIIFDDNGQIATPIDEFNTRAGAGLCGNPDGGSLATIPGTLGVGAYSSCLEIEKGKDIIFGLFDVDSGPDVPLCDSVRATAAALRISGTPTGDYLILTVPGEPTAPFAAYLRNQSPAGADRTLLLGYADDHIGYVLTAEDWLTGGYEPSINIWGPLEGEMLMDGILKAGDIAWTPEREDPEAGSSRFVQWAFPEAAPISPLVTSDHGTPAQTPDPIFWPDTADTGYALTASVARATGAARFAFYGGDAAIDLPQVTIERETSPNVFEPLLDKNGRPASSYDGTVVVSYMPESLKDTAPARHLYAATWQPVPADMYSLDDAMGPFSLPVGRYRFHVKGTAMSASGKVPYALDSAPFDVTEAPLAQGSSAQKGAAGVTITASLGAAPGMRALRDGVSDQDIPLLGPWTVEVTFTTLPKKTVSVTPTDGAGTVMLSAAELAEVVSVDVRDSAGNGGVLTL